MKSFVERKIDVQMALDGDTFDGSSNTVQLSGLRCQATVQMYSGTDGSRAANLQMRISGMKNADMAKLSTLGFNAGLYKKNAINVFAGDDRSGMSLIFQGGITYGNVDYNSMPDVGLEIVASAYAQAQYMTIAANSFKGDVAVASMIQSIANAAGLGFQNNGVTAVLSNHAVGGSAADQMRDILQAAGVHGIIHAGTVYIWPANGTRNDIVTELSPEKGMVGYPRYRVGGLDVTSIFDPSIGVGQRVKITSSTPGPTGAQGMNGDVVIPGANGTFYCGVVTHDLASQTPGGPWFTHMTLWINPDNARTI